jgi:hypothetical protein
MGDRGEDQPNSVSTDRSHGELACEVGPVFASGSQLPTKVEPTSAGSAQPSHSAHILIGTRSFRSSIVTANACRCCEVLFPQGRSLPAASLAPPARSRLEGLL